MRKNPPYSDDRPAPGERPEGADVTPAGRPEFAAAGRGEGRAFGFVALSKFVIANGLAGEVKEAFRNRPRLVEGARGFSRMDVICPLDRPEEIWLITFWTDEASYRDWHRSHHYHDSHRGIPKGLKLLPGGTEVRLFEHITS